MNGVHTNVFRTIDVMPRNSAGDYENIIKRLERVPQYVEQKIALFGDAVARGLVQPTVVVDRVLVQLRAQWRKTRIAPICSIHFENGRAAFPSPSAAV